MLYATDWLFFFAKLARHTEAMAPKRASTAGVAQAPKKKRVAISNKNGGLSQLAEDEASKTNRELTAMTMKLRYQSSEKCKRA